MAESIKEFLVSYGFSVDTSSMSKAESATTAAEARITAANAAHVNKRLAEEKKATSERIANAIKAGEQLSKDDRAFVLAQERERVDAADREKKRQLEAGKRRDENNKKAQAARDENFKRTEQQFLRLASAAIKFTAALDVAKVLDQLTFGSFGKLSGAASDLERMKYVGDSAGTSVKGLQAFGFAASQMGQSADAAQADLKRFGDQLKTFPGYEEQIKSFGVATRDMNGELRDAADIAKDLGSVYAKMPRATREAYASAQGFGEATLQAMIRPGFGGFYGQALADQSRIGADPNVAGGQASEFMRSLRHLNEVLHDVAVRIQTAIFPLIKPALDQITAWLLDHGASISGAVEKITKCVGDVAAAFAKSGLVKDALDSLNEGIENFAGYINSGEFRKDLKSFVADIKSVASAVRWALERLGILPSTAGAPVVPEPRGDHDVGFGGSVDDALAGGTLGAARRTLGYAAVAAGGQAGRGGGPTALRSEQQKANAAVIADELRKAGAPDEGTASVLGSMQTESSFNPRAHNDVTGGHTGLWQWDSVRWPKVRAWIEKQGGDPWDARWQTKAYIAEGRAKPGDAIYDNGETSAGFNDVMNSKGNLPKAVHGVQRSERFGRGEEGGRAAHAAKWMGHLPGTTDAAPAVAAAPSPTPTPSPASKPDTSKDTPLDTPGLVHLPEYEAADKILSSKTATAAQKAAAQKVMDRWNSQSFPSKVAGAGSGQPVGTSTDTTPVPGPSSYPTLRVNPKTGRKDTSDAPEIDHSRPTPAPPPANRGRDHDGVRTVDIPETSPSGQPVKVEVTDGSAAKIGGHVGKQFPSWMTRGRDGQAYQTTDMRDPKHAPKADDKLVKVEVTDGSAAKIGAHVGKAVPLSDASKDVAAHLANIKTVQAASHGLLHPFLHGHSITPAEALRRSVHNSIKHGNTVSVTHSPSYHVTAATPEAGLKMAKDQGERGTADLMRNVNPMVG